jgi:hypothetical protein
MKSKIEISGKFIDDFQHTMEIGLITRSAKLTIAVCINSDGFFKMLSLYVVIDDMANCRDLLPYWVFCSSSSGESNIKKFHKNGQWLHEDDFHKCFKIIKTIKIPKTKPKEDSPWQ